MESDSRTADPLAAASDLQARGVPFVLATVVRAVSPTSAKPGDKAVVTAGGLLTGWVGGSCAEPIVRREAAAALRDGECRLLHITPDGSAPPGRAGLSVHKMECFSGGELEIYVEPYLPMPSLLVFGNSPVASALCELGRVLRYRVTVVDLGDRPPMRGATEPSEAGQGVRLVRDLDALSGFDPAATFAVVASHGVFDDESIVKAVALGPRYLGLVASPKRRDELFAALRARGVSGDGLSRISAPAGLDLGARDPGEIALAVMAEIVGVRRATAHETPAPSALAAPGPRRLSLARPPPEIVAGPTSEPGAPAAAEPSCCHGKHTAREP
jgi:xanthine dehydrogenase accessory factor